jgi:hypothetical protein
MSSTRPRYTTYRRQISGADIIGDNILANTINQCPSSTPNRIIFIFDIELGVFLKNDFRTSKTRKQVQAQEVDTLIGELKRIETVNKE